MKAECTKQRYVTTVFPRIIAGGDYFFFFAQKGGDYSREADYLREATISNIAHWKSCPKCILFYYAIK